MGIDCVKLYQLHVARICINHEIRNLCIRIFQCVTDICVEMADIVTMTIRIIIVPVLLNTQENYVVSLFIHACIIVIPLYLLSPTFNIILIASLPGLRSISQQLGQLLGRIAITSLNDQIRSSASKYGANHMNYISWNILANRICLVTLINYHPY